MIDVRNISDYLEQIEKLCNSDVQQSEKLLQQLTDELCEHSFSDAVMAKIWRTASFVAFAKGDHIDAKKYGFMALDYAEKSGDDLVYHAAQNAIARSMYLEGEYSEALHYFQNSLPYYKQHNIVESIATTLNNVGSCYMNLGLWSNSLESHLEALELRRKMGVNQLTAQSLTNIGLVYFHLEEYNKCLEYQDDAEKIAIEIGNMALQAAIVANKAITMSKQHNHEQAIKELDQAIELNERIGDKPRIAIALLNKAVIYCDNADYNLATTLIEQALKLGEEVGDKHTVAAGFNVRGKIEYGLKNYSAAIEYYQKSLELTQKLHIVQEQCAVHQNLAEVYEKDKQWEKALWHFQQYYMLESQRTKEAANTKFNHFSALHEVEKLRVISEIEHTRNEELTALLAQRDEALALLEKQHTQLEELHREKNEFIGIASHDLKNPLIGLRSYATILVEDYDILTDDDLKESLLTIQSTADKTLAIVTKLLDINKLESGKTPVNPQPVNIAMLLKLLTKQYSEMAILKGITLKNEQIGTPVDAYSDDVLTVQIFENLISNALKFSPADTTVTARIIYPS